MTADFILQSQSNDGKLRELARFERRERNEATAAYTVGGPTVFLTNADRRDQSETTRATGNT